MHSPSVINIPHQNSTCVTIDEPVLTHRNHPKTIVYNKIQSWCCTFSALGQMYNDTYHRYSIRQSIFSSLKNLCVSPIHPHQPWQPPICLLSSQIFQNVSSLFSVQLSFRCIRVVLLSLQLTLCSKTTSINSFWDWRLSFLGMSGCHEAIPLRFLEVLLSTWDVPLETTS